MLYNNNSPWLSSFIEALFHTTRENFNAKAIELFHFQYENNTIYREYCNLSQRNVDVISTIQDIPFLPISAFKTHTIKSTKGKTEIIFESSGTSLNIPSKHHVHDLSLYTQSFMSCFEKFYGSVKDYHVLALLPSYLEREGSSLIKMVNRLITESNSTYSNFFLNNTRELHQILNQLNEQKEKVLLIGVSFALLDFVSEFEPNQNPNIIVMETGGMKGRRKEMVREELHEILKKGFQAECIHSEYGMTELLSQAYSRGEGKFQTPPWMDILIRKQDDPYNYCEYGEAGAINLIDFANVYSCSFIQTDDLGKLHKDGTFEVLGRFDSADVRGCNLMVN